MCEIMIRHFWSTKTVVGGYRRDNSWASGIFNEKEGVNATSVESVFYHQWRSRSNAYGVSHFAAPSKDTEWQTIKVRPGGALEYCGGKNKLILKTLTLQFEREAYYVFEALHRATGSTVSTVSRGRFRPRHFVDIGNCVWENFNKRVFRYFGWLISWDHSKNIYESSLVTNHTHKDIDHSFYAYHDCLKITTLLQSRSFAQSNVQPRKDLQSRHLWISLHTY